MAACNAFMVGFVALRPQAASEQETEEIEEFEPIEKLQQLGINQGSLKSNIADICDSHNSC